MAKEIDLDVFEQRLATLENLVFGSADKDSDYKKVNKGDITCSDSLQEMHSKINSSLAGKKKAALLYQQLPELKKLLDHSYTDAVSLSHDAIADSIIAETDFLKKQARLFEQLKENEKFINSEHIQGVVMQAEQLTTLSKIHISQQDEVASLTDESSRLIEAYNKTVSMLSKQFIMWDTVLTKMEQRTSK